MSTIQRLMMLPGIFTATDALLVARIPAAQLNNTLWRWKEAKLVQPLGARSDMWFNLVKDPEVSRDRWEQAVHRAIPGAIAAGHAVLMKHGITTQMSNADYLLRDPQTPSAVIEGATLNERPALWLRTIRRLGGVDSSGVLPELDPGAAVIDLMHYDPSSFDEDDIDWEELSPKSLALMHALAGTLGIEVDAAPKERSAHHSRPR